MKYQVALLLLLALLSMTINTQKTETQPVYQPFTEEEIKEVINPATKDVENP